MTLVAALRLNTGELIGWGVVAALFLWWLGWLFTRGMSQARKARALRTGDPAELTPDDRAENVKDFQAGLQQPKEMSPASAFGLLGVVLLVLGLAGVLVSKTPTTISSVAIWIGVILLAIGGAVAFGHGSSSQPPP